MLRVLPPKHQNRSARIVSYPRVIHLMNKITVRTFRIDSSIALRKIKKMYSIYRWKRLINDFVAQSLSSTMQLCPDTIFVVTISIITDNPIVYNSKLFWMHYLKKKLHCVIHFTRFLEIINVWYFIFTKPRKPSVKTKETPRGYIYKLLLLSCYTLVYGFTSIKHKTNTLLQKNSTISSLSLINGRVKDAVVLKKILNTRFKKIGFFENTFHSQVW